jgi:hypothetical protein
VLTGGVDGLCATLKGVAKGLFDGEEQSACMTPVCTKREVVSQAWGEEIVRASRNPVDPPATRGHVCRSGVTSQAWGEDEVGSWLGLFYIDVNDAAPS